MTQLGACMMVAANLLGGWLQQCRDPKVLDYRLERLTAAYVAYRLPLPPADTPLVRYQTRAATKDDPRAYALGFQLTPAKGDVPPQLLVGTLEWQAPAESVLPNPTLFGQETWFADWAFAVQCKARGWDVLAREALVRELAGPYAGIPEERIHAEALAYWSGQIMRPGSDRAMVARHLRLVLNVRPEFIDRHDLALIESLELSLVLSTAKPGSIQALIDDLIDVTTTLPRWGADLEPRYQRLTARGLEAVPLLIAHLSDERLTRAYRRKGCFSREYNCRVGDVVSDLLQGLSGDQFGLVRFGQGLSYRVDPVEAQKWWLSVREVGEKPYLIRSVLGEDSEAQRPHELMLAVLAAKYPDTLPDLYRTTLADRPKMETDTLVRAIVESAFPREAKRALLVEGSGQADLGTQYFALRGLRKVDPMLCDQLLKATLRTLPQTPTGWYWKCPEGRFASLVHESTDPTVWAALTAAARRVDLGLRLELLNLDDRPDDRARRKLLLGYLTAFLTDETTRDRSSAPEKFVGSCAASEFLRIRVGDFVAMQLGSLLKLKAEPDPAWTPADWERFRAEVRTALAREGVK